MGTLLFFQIKYSAYGKMPGNWFRIVGTGILLPVLLWIIDYLAVIRDDVNPPASGDVVLALIIRWGRSDTDRYLIPPKWVSDSGY